MFVIGETGSGKSRLLAAIEATSSLTTHRVQISPTEATLPRSGLSTIMASFHDNDAMQLSVNLLTPSNPEVSLVDQASALLSFFFLTTQAPALLLIDDIDVMDDTSKAVLAVVAGRLGGSHLRVIGTASSTPTGSLGSLPRMKLAPLSTAASMRLLSEPELPAMNEAVRQIIVAESNGNPGALVQNARGLSPEQLSGNAPIDIPFRVSRSSADRAEYLLSSEIADRRALLSQLACARLTSYDAITQSSEPITDVLDDLLTEGTVVREGNYVRIRDVLLRSRVYWSLGATSRLQCHAAAAKAEAAVDPDLALWHRSWSAPSRVSSNDLLSAATRFMRRGATAQAIELAERALILDDFTTDTSQFLFELARAMFHGGELAHASRYARLGQRQPDRIGQSPGLALLRARIEFMSSQQLLVTEVLDWVDAHGADDPHNTAKSLATMAVFHAERWEVDSAREALARAMDLQGLSERSKEMINRAAATIAAAAGDPVPMASAYDDIVQRGSGGKSAAELLPLGRSLTFVDRYNEARKIFNSILGMEPVPDPLWLGSTRYAMAENEIIAGNQLEAVAIIDRLHSEGNESQLHRNVHLLLMSWYWQAKDDQERATAAIAACHRSLAAGDNPALAARLEAYQGRFALLQGRLDESIAFLRSAASFSARLRMPALLRYEVDLIEAYVLSGRLPQALAQFHEFRARSAPYRTQWTMLAAARAHALVAPPESSIGAFQQAIKLWRPGDPQFELGRTVLSYSDRLASLGNAQESREQRLAARIIFTQLGAASWAKKADPARPRVGAAPTHPLMETLTWDERLVVNLVLQGLHNKEIAAELFVSLRTVEVRLTRIYQKLKARSRAHLAAILSPTEMATATTMGDHHDPLG